MKFRFVLIGLFVVFSSVGSYASGDKLGFSLESVKLKKNTWGGGNANLKVLLIYENSSGEASELRVVQNKNSPLHKTISLGTNAGLLLPINGNSIDVAVIILHEDEDAFLGSLIIKAIKNISKRKSIKFINKVSKSSWYTEVAKTVFSFGVDYGTDKIIAYLKKNEIYKTTITIRKGRNNWNNSNGKNGNSKIELSYETRFSGENGNSSNSSTQATNNSKWMTPSNSVCKSNGGWIKKGVCRANWLNAKKICNVSGRRLPTFNELEKVVTDCGAEPTDTLFSKVSKENKANAHYQSCYEEEGFVTGGYWSTTKDRSLKNAVWIVDFYKAYISSFLTNGGNYIRCIKK